MELAVLNASGAQTGRKVTLSEEIYNVVPNDHALYLDVKQYLANQRQGTHKAKERAEVSFSSRKLKKQKGTGGARAGSRKNPLFKGGGRIFGPRPRDYRFKLNKKLKQVARRSALTYKAKEAAISIVENLTFSKPQTKQYLQVMQALSLAAKHEMSRKTLLVVPEQNANVYLSSRNLERTKVVVAKDLNTYDILNADYLVLCEDSVAKIQEILGK